MAVKSNPLYLFISDLQIPYEHPKSLEFYSYIMRHYRIDPSNIFNVGDETDQYNWSTFQKDPDGFYTPGKELKETKERLKAWYGVFPKMKLCTSNHGIRWQKRALEANLPTELLRSVEEILKAPDGWIWQKRWKIDCKYPITVEHGDDWGGQMPHKQAVLYNGCSTILGHHHSLAGIEWIRTQAFQGFGAVIGCMIDEKLYAFHYAKRAKLKPLLGALIVFDGGKVPLWLPFDY